MKLLRAFIAIEIPSDIRSRIEQEIASLKKTIGTHAVRWVPPQNIHLTLKFLGDVSPTNLPLLKQILQTEIGNHTPFDLVVKNMGCFPNPRRPRIIWIGLETSPTIEAIQRTVDLSTARLGYALEERPFSPHLTIGRVAQNVSSDETLTIRNALENNKTGRFGTAHVTNICLFQSDLLPSGAKYTPLFHVELGQQTQT